MVQPFRRHNQPKPPCDNPNFKITEFRGSRTDTRAFEIDVWMIRAIPDMRQPITTLKTKIRKLRKYEQISNQNPTHETRPKICPNFVHRILPDLSLWKSKSSHIYQETDGRVSDRVCDFSSYGPTHTPKNKNIRVDHLAQIANCWK